jgi:glycosyltransferase involved in cell wall biosynthesis
MKARVTAILPTHDRASLLPRALGSVLGQSLPPDEIIVVDDGSVDGTGPLLAGRFPTARVVTQENAGVAAARNRGIREASGEWLAFIDSDDEWLPAKLARQMGSLEDAPRYPICHTDEIWIRRGRRVNPMKKHAKAGGFIFEECLPLCCISPSSVVVKKRLLEELGGFDETLPVCEDYDLWLRLTARHPVLFVDEPLLVKYGGHDDQLSRRHWGMDRFRIRSLEKIIAGGELSISQERAALETLMAKIDIYLGGARKRGRGEEVELYQEKRALYAARWNETGAAAS